MRRLTEYPGTAGENSLWRWTRYAGPFKVVRNFLVIWFCRYCPSLRVKNWFYRRIGMKVGRGVSAGLCATFDVFFPELITMGSGQSSVITRSSSATSSWRMPAHRPGQDRGAGHDRRQHHHPGGGGDREGSAWWGRCLWSARMCRRGPWSAGCRRG